MQYGGAVVDYFNQPKSAISEHADEIGILIAMVILLVALGSLVAMAVPISLALFALGCSSLLLVILEAHLTIGTVAPILGTMIALGVGIDYSLFIVSRHRQNLAAGMDIECLGRPGAGHVGLGRALRRHHGVHRAVRPRADPHPLRHDARVQRRDVRRRHRHRGHDPAAGDARPARPQAQLAWPSTTARSPTRSTTLAARWAHEVARRKVLFCVLSLGILLALAAPVLHIDLGFTVRRQRPERHDPAQGLRPHGRRLRARRERPAARRRGPAAAGPPTRADADRVTQPADRHRPDPGREVGDAAPIPNSDGTAAIIEVTPTTAPQDRPPADLVRTLRNDTIPKATANGPIRAPPRYVGGTTAVSSTSPT